MTDNKEEVVIPKLDDFIEESPAPEEAIEATPDGQEIIVDDPVELKAKDMGWVPKEEFKGDPDTWVDAKEFVGRAPLYEAIHKLNRQMKKKDEETSALREHHKKVFENAKKKAIEEYNAQLEQASDERDIKRALDIQKKIQETEAEEFEAEETALPKNPEQEVFVTWAEKNEWYQDPKLKSIATGYGQIIWAENPDFTYEEVLNQVTEKIKEKFPEKFGGQQQPTTTIKPRAPAVSGSATPRQGKATGKVTYSQLPEEAKTVYRLLVKSDRNPHGDLTHDEFITEYLAGGGTTETN